MDLYEMTCRPPTSAVRPPSRRAGHSRSGRLLVGDGNVQVDLAVLSEQCSSGGQFTLFKALSLHGVVGSPLRIKIGKIPTFRVACLAIYARHSHYRPLNSTGCSILP